MELAGRVAIVTGGGTGIGRATALRLAKAGAKAVVVNYSRSAGEAETTAKDVTALGAEAITHRSDVADEAQVKALVASTVDRYGRLDVLVNIASIAAHRASGSSIAYAVSKAGVVQLTRALALALAPEVRVNSVSPGLVSTRWFSSRFGDEAAAAQEEAFAKQTPVQKIATPDDVARAVIALLENDLITGQDLVVDGGKNVLYQALV